MDYHFSNRIRALIMNQGAEASGENSQTFDNYRARSVIGRILEMLKFSARFPVITSAPIRVLTLFR